MTAHPAPQNDQFQLILVSRSTKRVLVERQSVLEFDSGFSLPQISVPKWTRWALHIQQAIKQRWNLQSVVLDVLGERSRGGRIAIAEAIDDQAISPISGHFALLPLGEIPHFEIEDADDSLRIALQDLLDGKTNPHAPFLQLGWTNELLQWIPTVISTDRIDIDDEIEQFNASSSHALLKIRSRRGPSLWFKAVAEPILESAGHEYVATTVLSNLFPEYLPRLLAIRADWKGWLMNDAGLPIEESDPLEIEIADMIGTRLAEMQRASVLQVDTLLRHGFIDQRIPALRDAMLGMMPYFEDAVLSQRSAAAPTIEIGRLKEIAEIFEDVCLDLEETEIPDTVVHNDLKTGNILIGNGSCVFTDWAQAGVGNPLVALDQLQQYLAQNQRLGSWVPLIVRSYREHWRSRIADVQFDRALRSIRLLSIVTHLASRRHWFMSRDCYKTGLESYIRSLLRQMDTAAQSLQCEDLSEVICERCVPHDTSFRQSRYSIRRG